MLVPLSAEERYLYQKRGHTLHKEIMTRSLNLTQLGVSDRLICITGIAPRFKQVELLSGYLGTLGNADSYELEIATSPRETTGLLANSKLHDLMTSPTRPQIEWPEDSDDQGTSPVNIITWMCHGADDINFLTNFTELVMVHSSDVVFLVETRVDDDTADLISTSLGFSGVVRTPANNGVGGIWLLWEIERVRVAVFETDSECIHALIGRKIRTN